MLQEWSVYIVSGVLIWLFYNFVREKMRSDLAVLLAVGLLLALGQLTPKEVLGVFSNSAPITIACLFILSAALERTGVVAWLGDLLSQHAGSSLRQMLLMLMLTALCLSALINNTPVVMILTPVAITLANSRGIKPSKLLIPLSYATILGGMTTMVGTSTNILVDGIAREMGLAPFGMFELTGAALLIGGVGIALLLIFAPRALPDRETISQQLGALGKRTYMAELFVPPDSAMVGKTALEARLANHGSGVQVVKIFRGDEEITDPPPGIVLCAGDRLILHTPMADILSLRSNGVVTTAQRDPHQFETLRESANALVLETIVGRNSRYCNRPMRDLDLTARYGIHVMAVHRKDANIQGNLDDFQLEFGDVLLVEGTPQQIQRFVENGDLLALGPIKSRALRRERAPVAVATTIGVMLLAALGVMPIEGLAIIGAGIVVASGCLDMDDAYKSIEWPILILIFGMLAVSIAMQKAGIVAAFGDFAMLFGVDVHPLLVLALIVAVTSVMTEMVSNNAVAVLMTPIAISVATALGLDPRPFVVGVMLAASASFATPIGYQTNTFVYNAGGYKFRDFFTLGIPLNLAVWLLSVLIIPLIWPLQP